MWGEEQKPGNYNWAEKIKANGNLDKGHQKSANANRSNFCHLCGAWRGSYGLEPTPDCGRPFMELRPDLTEKEREYVLDELKKAGLI